jgi:hypothetical protein
MTSEFFIPHIIQKLLSSRLKGGILPTMIPNYLTMFLFEAVMTMNSSSFNFFMVNEIPHPAEAHSLKAIL